MFSEINYNETTKKVPFVGIQFADFSNWDTYKTNVSSFSVQVSIWFVTLNTHKISLILILSNSNNEKNFCDCNGTRTHNYLVWKPSLSHLGRLVCDM